MSDFNKIVSFAAATSDIQDKDAAVAMYIKYMLARTARMFKWNNLPEHIGQRELELIIQSHGYAAVCQAPDTTDLYAFFGGPGGAPDPYYMPTTFIVANPALGSKTYKINDDCIIIPNDTSYTGLMPMFARYATMMAENELSLYLADVNARIISLITAKSDSEKAAAEKYLSDVADGKLGVIAQNAFLEGVSTQPYGTATGNNHITQLIEMQQYLKASWFNDLGLQANYNMKREAINTSEAQLDQDALIPLAEDMLRCRQEAADKINEMFGTDISVEFDSVWEENAEVNDIELEQMKLTVEEPAEEPAEEISEEEPVEEEPAEEEPAEESEEESEEETSEESAEEAEDVEPTEDDELAELTEAVEELTEAVDNLIEETEEEEEDEDEHDS